MSTQRECGALCWAVFDMYLGASPVTEQLVTSIADQAVVTAA